MARPATSEADPFEREESILRQLRDEQDMKAEHAAQQPGGSDATLS